MQSLRQLFTRRHIYRDLSEQIQQHLEEKIDAPMADGMSREEVKRAARREFGNIALIDESGREAWMWPGVERMFSDVTFAI
jgi:hypothetical protein